jgi:amino acid adenylation domain-containing protein
MQFLLHHLLEDSADRSPDAIAVVDRSRVITYAELDHRANQLAHLLIDLGVERGDRVGFYLDKSLESLIAIYGILKAGAAYVPFDPLAPPARLSYIAANAGIRHLMTGAEKAPAWPDLLAGSNSLETLVVLNSTAEEIGSAAVPTRVIGRDEIERKPSSRLSVGAIHLDLAYILYTSGSTGHPKGVMLSHLNALAFVDWTVDCFDIQASDRLSSHAPLHFDLSIFDLFAAAKAGARVVLVPPEASFLPVEVKRFIVDSGITIWYSVPSILSMLAQRGGMKAGEFPALRTILFAGEVFPTKYLRRMMELLPHVRWANLYGPTETNVCTYFEVPPLPEDKTDPIPIGRAIDNVEVFAVKDDGTRASPGEVGELYVRGSTVMQGYWKNHERSAKNLVANPLGGELHDPVYRTGDLVKEDEDGNYEFLGRRDHQIKSRGYRIELGDIENALYAHPQVVECAVIAVPDELISNRIQAHVVVRGPISRADLVRFCAQRIPKYMIPEKFEFEEGLPKTSTGKVDRQALRSLASAPS